MESLLDILKKWKMEKPWQNTIDNSKNASKTYLAARDMATGKMGIFLPPIR
jgi:hypothetical protein